MSPDPKHGKPYAKIIPAQSRKKSDVNDAIERLKLLRKGTSLAGLDWKELRDEGRK
jgi:antitoxin (DNA-binding transcriptional repressor) of toxin-antitoxin stability system